MQRKHTFKTVREIVIIILLFVGIIGGVSQAFKIFEYFSKASGESANIQIDVSINKGGVPRVWRNLAQGGEDKDWRIGSLVPKVKTLNPMYIRIDHIYDFYDIVKKENGQLIFNWTKFDLVINDILATGAKPFISLSYMPPDIAKDGDITGTPSSWEEYQTVIYNTIHHLSKERGIADVYYEVWNEPDLFGQWKTYGEKNYLTLYSVASNAAKQVTDAKTFKLGGPGTTALYKNWFDALAKQAIDNSLRLDFISWHRYSNDIDQFQKDVVEANSWMQDYPQLANTELLITEWGHDSKNHSGYDTSYSAAHTVSVATELMGNITKAFTFEIQDGKDPENKEFWGRWGLFTHGSEPKAKPRYTALQFLENLGDNWVDMKGKGSWVKGTATLDGNIIKVILSNFDQSASHYETVPVTLLNTPFETYAMQVQYINGNAITNTINKENGVLKTQIPMNPNSVAFITLTPQ